MIERVLTMHMDARAVTKLRKPWWIPFIQTGPAQFLHRKRQHRHGHPVGVQNVRFAHAEVLLRVHARSLGGRDSVADHGAGEDCAVDCGSLDHSKGVGVGSGAARDPFDGPIDAGGGRRE